MDIAINIAIALALFTTLAILCVGVFGMVRGGAFNDKWGNKLMRWRVMAQAVSIGVLFLGFLYKSQHG